MNLLSALGLALHILLVLTVSIVISARRRPSEAISWILAITFIPVIGIIVFLLIGVGRLPKARRKKQAAISSIMLARPSTFTHRTEQLDTPPWFASAVQLNDALGSLPMVGGNQARLLDDYGATLQAIADDIDSAVSHVEVQFYILVRDEATTIVFDAMARAAARGVRVRVLSDFVSGLMFPRRRETLAALKEAGIEWMAMLPLRPWAGQWTRPDMRNHRKIVVIDDEIGYMGSLNMIDSSYLKPGNLKRGLRWLELMVRLQGPIVAELGAVFATDWYSETNELLPVVTKMHAGAVETPPIDAQVVPSGPSFENDNNLKLFVYLIQSAQRRISITSPYFVPDESTMIALITAASRGVHVELFVSEVDDQKLVFHAQRSNYLELLEAGIEIYLYRSPTVLHSKHFSIDDDVAVIGSSNMDIRSFRLNMEVSLLVRDAAFVSRLRAVEDDYRENSHALGLEEWRGRPIHEKIWDSLARLTSSLQ